MGVNYYRWFLLPLKFISIFYKNFNRTYITFKSGKETIKPFLFGERTTRLIRFCIPLILVHTYESPWYSARHCRLNYPCNSFKKNSLLGLSFLSTFFHAQNLCWLPWHFSVPELQYADKHLRKAAFLKCPQCKGWWHVSKDGLLLWKDLLSQRSDAGVLSEVGFGGGREIAKSKPKGLGQMWKCLMDVSYLNVHFWGSCSLRNNLPVYMY